jgi:hypothetical protein
MRTDDTIDAVRAESLRRNLSWLLEHRRASDLAFVTPQKCVEMVSSGSGE